MTLYDNTQTQCFPQIKLCLGTVDTLVNKYISYLFDIVESPVGHERHK